MLRGARREELKKLKSILACSAYIAADVATEAACVYDFGGTVPGTIPPPANSSPDSLLMAQESRDSWQQSRSKSGLATGLATGHTAAAHSAGAGAGGTSHLRTPMHSAIQTLSVESVLGARRVATKAASSAQGPSLPSTPRPSGLEAGAAAEGNALLSPNRCTGLI